MSLAARANSEVQRRLIRPSMRTETVYPTYDRRKIIVSMFCERVNGTVSGTTVRRLRPTLEGEERGSGRGSGSERGEVDRRDVISRVMNEVTDETSEKAGGSGDGGGRFTTFRSVAYTCYFSAFSRLSRTETVARCLAEMSASQHVPLCD